MARATKSWKGSCQGVRGFNCNNKIIGARYFNKGSRASGDAPVEDSARDVASIAAGKFVPNVSFFGYRPGSPSTRCWGAAGRCMRIDSDYTTLAIRSGHDNPNRALKPGLVYDASTQDLVCSMDFTPEQTRSIVGSSYDCSNPWPDLNYPSFVSLFHFDERGKIVKKEFRRTVTNVGDGAASYRVRREIPANSTVRIRPEKLVFGKKYEKKSYTLTVRYRADIDNPLKVGSVVWIDESGEYKMRSPVVLYGAADNFGY